MVRRTTGPDDWLICRAPRPNARLRLFCVPFAGGGASAFSTWAAAFPDIVELRAIQLPGREHRHHESTLDDAYEAARRIADAIQRYLDGPYAFFGYSMGALIAFEVVRELRRRGARMPEQLFVGAKSAPSLPATHPPIAHLPREAFLEQVRYYYEPPVAAWENLDLIELVLPALRADIALCEKYVYCEEPPFGFPIQAFAGLHDRSVPLSAVQTWNRHTTAEFAMEVFDGAHFFLQTSLAHIQRLILSRMALSGNSSQ
jgi:medium-chain acyl-[acyl-carrier-protein] hydrolase